jgi:hypothetical protein
MPPMMAMPNTPPTIAPARTPLSLDGGLFDWVELVGEEVDEVEVEVAFSGD